MNLGYPTSLWPHFLSKNRRPEWQLYKLIALKFMIQYIWRALRRVFGLQKISVSGTKYYYDDDFIVLLSSESIFQA